MKKTISLLLAICMLLSLCACGKSDTYKKALAMAEDMNDSYSNVQYYYAVSSKLNLQDELLVFIDGMNMTLEYFLMLDSSEMSAFKREIAKKSGDGYDLLSRTLDGELSSLLDDPEFYLYYLYATSY